MREGILIFAFSAIYLLHCDGVARTVMEFDMAGVQALNNYVPTGVWSMGRSIA